LVYSPSVAHRLQYWQGFYYVPHILAAVAFFALPSKDAKPAADKKSPEASKPKAE
jgi:hypothetical protein